MFNEIETYSDLDELLKNKSFAYCIFDGILYGEKNKFWMEIEKKSRNRLSLVEGLNWEMRIFSTTGKSGGINKGNPIGIESAPTKKDIKLIVKKEMLKYGFKFKDDKTSIVNDTVDLNLNIENIEGNEEKIEEKILKEAFHQIFEGGNLGGVIYEIKNDKKGSKMKINFGDNQSKGFFTNFIKTMTGEITVKKTSNFRNYYIVFADLDYKSHTGKNSLSSEVFIYEKGLNNDITFIGTREQIEKKHGEEIR